MTLVALPAGDGGRCTFESQARVEQRFALLGGQVAAFAQFRQTRRSKLL